MPPRAMRCIAMVLLLTALGLGVVGFLAGLHAESTTERVLEGLTVLIDLGTATAATFLIWPVRA